MTPRARRAVFGVLALGAAALGVWGAVSLARDRPGALALAGPADGPLDETRFTRRVVVEGLDEPMALDFDPEGRVYWVERTGGVKRYDPRGGEVALLGRVPVRVEGEAGLMGILLDRDFAATRRIYLYFSAAGEGERREIRLSRFTLGADGRLDPASEVVVLRWPYDLASHFGGGMVWDAQGNLYLSTGDNTNAKEYAPLQSTKPGGKGEDSQRTAGNTDDPRGKILRIRPRPDGGYDIPPGNLFPPGTPRTRPEIYTMGNRQPWRLSIDPATGWLYWGEIGPDAGKDSTGVGPMGYDEFNVAKSAGNYGWPFVIGYNRAYHAYDNAARAFGPPVDTLRPVNPSPNNTGLRELPPARRALLAYPYGVSEEYPQLGSGGRAAVGGPVFRRAAFTRPGATPFPAHFEGKWVIVDYVRNWIMLATLDEAGTRIAALERFLPRETYLNPIDMDFGPDGALYLLEYAPGGEGKLSRVEYNPGNRAPRVTVAVDRAAGATPLRVALSSRGTVDPDGDRLRYQWVVTPEGGGAPQRFAEPNPALALTRPGAYTAALTVTDAAGAADTGTVRIVAGNEPPQLALEVVRGNRSFYFPDSALEYRVRVSDREDGTLGRGIAPESVVVTAEYVPAPPTPAEAARARELDPTESVANLRAYSIMAGTDCSACHSEDRRLLGPAFREVAARYARRADAEAYLAGKIVGGSTGVWGPAHMPAHPNLTPAQATTLARYVLGLARSTPPERLPLQGSYATPVRTEPKAQGGQVPQVGAYVLRAAYTDRGARGVAPLTAGRLLLLRYPKLAPESADTLSEGISYAPSRWDPMFIVSRSGAFVGFRGIDLTGVGSIEVAMLTRFYNWGHFKGATVEVRLDSPTGPRLGRPATLTPDPSVTLPIFFGDPRMDRPVAVDATGASGVHDLYLVFTNPATRGDDALVLLTGIEFKPR